MRCRGGLYRMPKGITPGKEYVVKDICWRTRGMLVIRDDTGHDGTWSHNYFDPVPFRHNVVKLFQDYWRNK